MRFILAVLLAGVAFAKNDAAVTGINNFIHATSDLQKTTQFYQDVFGFAKPAPSRPPNPAVPGLINAPGAELQVQVIRLPAAGFGFELTHFGAIELKSAAPPKFSDPGAGSLAVQVRDLDPILAALKKAGATIVSNGGRAVQINSDGVKRAIVARDPDGFLLGVAEMAAPPADAPAGNVIGASMCLTVADMHATVKFYRDLLGYSFEGSMDFLNQHAILDAAGVPGTAQFRKMSAIVPGTRARMNFYEFKGVPRAPFHMRVPDPGTPAVALQVNDLPGLLERMKPSHVPIISAGGKMAQFSGNIRNIFVEDPNGFKIELFETTH
jgi:catechol 2,3-dioxygenase-like lactoylglutathione lyase family enzyme